MTSQIDEVKNEIEAIKDEEQDKYDNMAENFQNGEKGECKKGFLHWKNQSAT